jgi:ribonuclease VapC
MIVVDSSAIIAIMLGEPSRNALISRLLMEDRENRRMASATYVEAGTVFISRFRATAEAARVDYDAFLKSMDITVVDLTAVHAAEALSGYIRFGRGSGTRAKLNLGDCFAYALAKSLAAPLLFVGEDFAATDVTPALQSA